MTPLPVRLMPGDDLRGQLEELVRTRDIAAAFVIAGIGSLSRATIRVAGVERAVLHEGALEIIALGGTLSPDGPHLHASLADADGHVFGGHVASGCIVRTTAEILVAVLPGFRFARHRDAATGYRELVIARMP